MIKIFLCLLLIAQSTSAEATSKEKINISGTITGYPDSTVVTIKNLDKQVVVGTTLIINNRFSLSVAASEPVPHGIFIGVNNDYLFFWLEDSDITISGTKENIRNSEISGGKVQRETQSLFLATRPLSLRFDSVNAESRKAYEENDLVRANSLELVMDTIIHDRIQVGAQHIREHPDHFMSAFTLVGYIPGLTKPEIKSLYECLSPDIKESRYGKSVASYLELSKDVAVGDIAGDFKLTDLNGNSIGLENFKGKFILLDFWAAGCAPCRMENKNLVKAYKKYKSKGFEIISITSDRNKEHWRKASEEDSITWASLQDTGHVGTRYNVKFIPWNFLIDPSGRIIAINLRAEKLEEKLKELFE